MRYVAIDDITCVSHFAWTNIHQYVQHSYTRYIKTSRLRYPSISSNNTVYPILKQGFGLVTSNHGKIVDSGVSHQLSYQIHYQRHDNCEELRPRVTCLTTITLIYKKLYLTSEPHPWPKRVPCSNPTLENTPFSVFWTRKTPLFKPKSMILRSNKTSLFKAKRDYISII